MQPSSSPRDDTVLPSPAVKSARSEFPSAFEVVRAHHVSTYSALKEGFENHSQRFVEANLAPLSERRQQLERLERVLSLQIQLVRLFQSEVRMTESELMLLYQKGLDELVSTMALAFHDYLMARTTGTDQERAVHVEKFKSSLTKEREHWPNLCVTSRADAEEFLCKVENLLEATIDATLQIDAQQVEETVRFQELEKFCEKKLKQQFENSDSQEQQKLDSFFKLCVDGNVEKLREVLDGIGSRKKQKAFLSKSNSVGETCGHVAARYAQGDVLNFLLARGFIVSCLDSWHHLPLAFWAVSNPGSHCEAVLKILDQHNALHVRAEGKSPLHFAVRFGHMGAVTQLVELYGFDPNDAEEKTGRSSLHLSCTKGYMGITSYLLAHGANVFLKNKAGETPLFEAYLSKCGPLVLLFSRKGLVLTALEQAKLKATFRSDPAGLRLLALPHKDALRRLEGFHDV